jgi:hypothetical protein
MLSFSLSLSRYIATYALKGALQANPTRVFRNAELFGNLHVVKPARATLKYGAEPGREPTDRRIDVRVVAKLARPSSHDGGRHRLDDLVIVNESLGVLHHSVGRPYDTAIQVLLPDDLTGRRRSQRGEENFLNRIVRGVVITDSRAGEGDKWGNVCLEQSSDSGPNSAQQWTLALCA